MKNAESPIVDWEGLTENFEHDKVAISMVVETFLDTIGPSLEKIRSAIERAEAREIAIASHNLKGAISNFGARRAVSLAQSLENIGSGEESGDAERLYHQLQGEVETIIHELSLLKARLKA